MKNIFLKSCPSDRIVGYALGEEVGQVLSRQLFKDKVKHICLTYSVEDEESFVRGVLSKLPQNCFDVSSVCFWNRIDSRFQTASIVRRYMEPKAKDADALVVVRSSMSDTDDVSIIRSNLTNLVQITKPEVILLVAPVVTQQTQIAIGREFTREISDKFKYVCLVNI